MGSGEDGGDVCCSGGVETVVHGGRFSPKDGCKLRCLHEGVGEETLAGSPDEDGQVELAEVLEMREDGVVFVEALAEAKAWVEDDFFSRDAGRDGGCEAFPELIDDEGEDFAGCEFGEGGPVLRATSGVHEDCPAAELGAGCGHSGVPEVAADVVDDLGADFDGAAGSGRVVGVDGEDGGGALFQQGFDDREDAGLLFFGRERSGVGARGFAAEVEDVGAFIQHAEGLRDGSFGSVFGGIVEAAVGERVRRDIEDAHDEGSLAERKGACAEMPVMMSAGGEGHGGILW